MQFLRMTLSMVTSAISEATVLASTHGDMYIALLSGSLPACDLLQRLMQVDIWK